MFDVADSGTRMPKVLRLHRQQGSSQTLSMLMTDLQVGYPISSTGLLDWEKMDSAIAWLARFHAFGWHNNLEHRYSLQPEGGYWYIQTRLEELKMMRKEWVRLQIAAPAIAALCNGKHTGWTLVHGDFKAENLMFSKATESEPARCAAVDFQYVGGGYGAKDLVMLVVCGGNMGIDDLEHGKELEAKVLTCYFRYLELELKRVHQGAQQLRSTKKITLELLKTQYELALLDFVRFLAGWGFW
jgi:hypothetical protein